ncbi:hypothetical protein SDC9_06477 [bioreactor metagenome]|uniref:Uncharacterized protein n=1 Tax=bioreactor metagenome TaxID=1076179 RepID=A0A644T1Y6_9ZZZZ
MARDQDDVGLRLRHARRDRADARRRHQLHRDLGARVDLLEVVDQLREVLDRVDVVVRRRRDQRHALGRVPQTCDELGHLHARKLAALAGLGALRDLDFQLFAVVQVFGGHAEPARGHLLDLRRRVVAVRFGHEMRRILAALATVRLRADAVHRDVQGLVRLRPERAERHAGGDEALADRGDRFHLLDRHRLAERLDVEQVTDVNRRVRPHHRRILLPQVIARPVAGRLQHVHRLRFPGVLLAGAARLVEAADRQHVLTAKPALRMHLLQLVLDAVQADAGDARMHAREELGHHGARQAHRLEVQTTAIGGDDRDPHLRHDLQQARVDRVTIAAHVVDERAGQQAALDAVIDAVLREVGVHRRRARADQHGEVMAVDAFGRAHVHRGEGPQPLAGQPRMHRRGREDHRHRHLLGILMLVGQHEVQRARAHRVLRLGADPLEPLAQRFLIGAGGEGAVDHRHRVAEDLHHLGIFGIGDERAFEDQDLGLRAVLVEHVLQVAEAGLQRHHPAFTKGVDRRVGDLGEVLPEEVAQRAILLRQHRGRRVVAHRGERFLAVLGHRCKDLLEILERVARGDLPLAQLGARVQRLFRHVAHDRVQVDHLLDPVAEGLAVGEPVLDLLVVVEPALAHVDGDHLPRPERALFAHVHLVDRDHARLGARDQHAVAGHHIAHRAQPVAVEPAADPAAVGHRQRRRAIPGLHHRVAVGIHVLPLLRHVGRRLRPGLGHQHRLRHRRRAARTHHHLEHGIKRARVGGARRDDRLDVLGRVAEGRGGHADLVALHPVDVALQRVDLAVMGEHAEGLRQPPLREGVGGIALVVDREGRFKALVLQVRVELGDLLGQHHALVDDRARRQRADVEPGDLRRDRRLLDAAADDVELALEGLVVDVLLAADQDLLDLGTGRIRLLAQHLGVHRHVAPAIDVVPHPQHFALDDRAAALLRAEVDARQEDLADGDLLFHVRLVAGAADLVIEEGRRDLHVDARAIARLAVGIDRAAVPDRLQRLDAARHDPARGLAVQRHDETDAAGRLLVVLAVERVLRHPLALRFLGGNPGFIVFRHHSASSESGTVRVRGHVGHHHVAIKFGLGRGKALVARKGEGHGRLRDLAVVALDGLVGLGVREEETQLARDQLHPLAGGKRIAGAVLDPHLEAAAFEGHAADRHTLAGQLVVADVAPHLAVRRAGDEVVIVTACRQQRAERGVVGGGGGVERVIVAGREVEAPDPAGLPVDVAAEELALAIGQRHPLIARGVGRAAIVVGDLARMQLHRHLQRAARRRCEGAAGLRRQCRAQPSEQSQICQSRTHCHPSSERGRDRPRRPKPGAEAVAHSAATREAPSRYLTISAPASRPSRIAQTTSDAPRTMSPTA